MRIAIVCNDTRGGVQPYLALGAGLAAAGHDVTAVTPSGFVHAFATLNIPTTPLSGTSEAELKASTQIAERGMLATMRYMRAELPRRIQTWTRETLAACEGADVITGGVGGMVIGTGVAEKLGVPFVQTHLQPIGAPATNYPGVLLSGVPSWMGTTGRHLSHILSDKALWMTFNGPMASARDKVLGLTGKPRTAAPATVFYGFSRHIVDVPAPSIGSRHVTGYWTFPNDEWQPSAELTAFLERGGPVVSIGFGSMASTGSQRANDLVIDAAREAGVRAILLSGSFDNERNSGSDDVFFANNLPHDWLFPRMAAVVHHGGAGTTGAALTAGAPAIVVPFTMDQPFWGQRVAALGVGPRPIPRKRLTRKLLADALRATVGDKDMADRAAALGSKLRGEHGVANAVSLFTRLR